MSRVLVAAGLYNLAWGAWTVLAPNQLFDWVGAARPNYPQLWQCIGMIVGVYGVGYLAASINPLRHWPIVLVGLLGKVFGPIGFAQALYQGVFPLAMGWMIVTNDLIWWAPFALILAATWRGDGDTAAAEPLADVLNDAKTPDGPSLMERSHQRRLLLVFLRHAGCVFCRQALADLAAQRSAIEATGTSIVLVHMGTDRGLQPLLARYGLQSVLRIGDPGRRLYRALGLRRGTLWQLFGPGVWLGGLRSIRQGIGALQGDGLQMPGVFLIYCGRVVHQFVHRSAADRPDYAALAAGGGASADSARSELREARA